MKKTYETPVLKTEKVTLGVFGQYQEPQVYGLSNILKRWRKD